VLGDVLTVDATWYAEWAAPAGLLLLALTGVCLSVGWRGPRRGDLLRRLVPALATALLAAALGWLLGVRTVLSLGAVSLAGLTGAAAVLRALALLGVGRSAASDPSRSSGDAPANDGKGRARAATRLVPSLGAVTAHLGLALFVLGVSGEARKQEETLSLARGRAVSFGAYSLDLEALERWSISSGTRSKPRSS
jgi:cytochrome c biogenesis factor